MRSLISKNETEMKNIQQLRLHLDTVSAAHDVNAYLELLKVDRTLTLVGAPENPLPVAEFPFAVSGADISPGLSSAVSERRKRCWIFVPTRYRG